MHARPATAGGCRVKARPHTTSLFHKLYGYEHFNTKLHKVNISFLKSKEKVMKLWENDEDNTFITHVHLAAKKPKYVECDYSNMNDYIREIDYMCHKQREDFDSIKEIRKRLIKTRHNLNSHKKVVMSIIGNKYFSHPNRKQVKTKEINTSATDVMAHLIKIQEKMNNSAISMEQELLKCEPYYSRFPSRPITPYTSNNPITRPSTSTCTFRKTAFSIKKAYNHI